MDDVEFCFGFYLDWNRVSKVGHGKKSEFVLLVVIDKEKCNYLISYTLVSPPLFISRLFESTKLSFSCLRSKHF